MLDEVPNYVNFHKCNNLLLLTITMKACSLIVNLPGLTSNESFPRGTLHLGSFSHARPIGKTRI
jgi:hypothetical protein